MAENYNRDADRNDTVAKTLAIIALIVALLALGWAIKADNNANDIDNRVGSSQQSQNALPAEDSVDAIDQSDETATPADTTDSTPTPDTTNPDVEEQP